MYIAQKTDKFIKAYKNIKYIKNSNDAIYVNIYIFKTIQGMVIIDVTKWNGRIYNTIKLLYMSKQETNNFIKKIRKEGFINGMEL